MKEDSQAMLALPPLDASLRYWCDQFGRTNTFASSPLVSLDHLLMPL